MNVSYLMYLYYVGRQKRTYVPGFLCYVWIYLFKKKKKKLYNNKPTHLLGCNMSRAGYAQAEKNTAKMHLGFCIS